MIKNNNKKSIFYEDLNSNPKCKCKLIIIILYLLTMYDLIETSVLLIVRDNNK